MVRLSKESRIRVDAAVMQCAAALYRNNTMLCGLNFSRPKKFSSVVAQVIYGDSLLRESLQEEDLLSHPEDTRISILDSSIKRLLRAGKLTKASIRVPVIIGKVKPNNRIEDRPMTCYWPIQILDELASC